MSSRRLSFTEKRRAKLARSVAQLDKLETRNTITEPISVLGLSLTAFRGLAQIGLMDPNAMSNGLSGLVPPEQATGQGRHRGEPRRRGPGQLHPDRHRHSGRPTRDRGRRRRSAQTGSTRPAGAKSHAADGPAAVAPAATPASTQSGISAPWHPAKGPGGGAALPPRGGSGAGPATAKPASRHAAAAPSLPASTPAASNSGAAAALLAAVAGASDNAASAPATGQRSPVHTAPAGLASQTAPAGSTPVAAHSKASPLDGSDSDTSGNPLPGSTPDPVVSNASGPSQQTFQYFPMYVLDVNDGVVLYPGVEEQATLDGSVILQAQVSGTTVSSYNWNTTGLPATDISGGSTYQLSFIWTNENETNPDATSVTLSVTDTNSHTETYTYDFLGPASARPARGGGTDATWPTTLCAQHRQRRRPVLAQRRRHRRFQLGISRYVDPVAELQPQRAGARFDLRLRDRQPAADHHRGEPPQQLVGRPVPGQRHLDLQRLGRNDLLLQHQHAQPRRRAADRPPVSDRRWRPAGTAIRSRSSTTGPASPR